MHVKLRQTMLVIVAIVLLISGPIFTTSPRSSATVFPITALPELPGCVKAAAWNAPWKPEFSGVDRELQSSYQCDGYKFHVYLAQYFIQNQGKEAVSQANHAIPKSWRYGRTQA